MPSTFSRSKAASSRHRFYTQARFRGVIHNASRWRETRTADRLYIAEREPLSLE
ncbi:hypothetical protein ARSEF1564_001143 [Beauveria bassiana]